MLAEKFDIPYPCDVVRCPFKGVDAPDGMPRCQYYSINDSRYGIIACFKKHHTNGKELIEKLKYSWV